MKIKSVFAVMLVSLLLAACNDDGNDDEKEVLKFVNKVRYVKDRNGICYAFMSNRTYLGFRVKTFTEVDCAKVVIQ